MKDNQAKYLLATALLFSVHLTSCVLTYLFFIDPWIWSRPHCYAVYSRLKDIGYYNTVAKVFLPLVALGALAIIILVITIIRARRQK